MNRVATGNLQQTLMGAIQRAQRGMAATEAQLSGKKAQSLSELGSAIVPTLSARAMLAQQDAYSGVTTRMRTTLSLYDAHISSLDAMGSALQKNILTAVGTTDAGGLQEAIANAFSDFRSALNASEGGVPLFGGGSTDDPFTPQTLADVAATPADQAFANGPVKPVARVADNRDLQYGVVASDLGGDLYTVFQTLAAAGPIGSKPTAAQTAALKTAIDQLGTALATTRGINADNGRHQAEVDALTERAAARGTVLKGLISTNEDADLGEVATQLAQQQTLLQVTYATFAKISGLNLVEYLR